MAGFLPSASKSYLLSQIATKGTRIGLAISIPNDVGPAITLANLVEVNTPGYARAAVTWAAPSTDASGITSMANLADVNFPAVTADMTPAPYAFVTDAASGTAGTVYYIWTLAEAVATLSGKPTLAPAGGLIIE